MKKLFAMAVILALFVFGLTLGASAADTPTRTEYLDLSAQSNDSSASEGWTWTVDGSKGTLTLYNLYLKAPSLVNGQVKDMVAFPGGVTDIQIVLQGSNIIQKTDTFQCDIFAAAGKSVTISGAGSLEFRSADKNSTLVNCDSLVMESGTISMATDCQAGYLFHTQNGLTITGGSMTFKSTYGIRSEKGPINISGGSIDLTMTNPGYGIYAGPTLAADANEVVSPAITISGGTITTNGSISDAWFKGLSITGGSIKADKEVRGNLFYEVPGNKVTLPDGFSTEQLSTTNSYILEIPSGGTLEVPASVRVYTNHLINEGELDNRGRVTVRNSYKGEGMITGGGLIDFTSSYWAAVNTHAQNAVLNRSVTNSIDETGYCYVYGNALWDSGWGYTPKTMYIPKGGHLTVSSGADIQVSGPITIHGADSLTGEGTVTSTAGKYYIEYSADSLTPAAEMDLTYDGTNLREEVEKQAKEKTPDTTILNQTFVLGGDNLAIGYPYGSSSACPAGEGGNRYIEYNFDVAAFPYHRISYRHYFSVEKLQITNETTLEKTVNLNTPYTGSPVNFPETFLKVTHNGKQIIINGNFDISYSNNVEVGDNAVITLTGKNNVEGTLALNYTISPKDLYTSEIVLSSAEKVYDGTTGIAPEKVLSLANKGVVDRDKGMVGITADVAFDTKDVGDEKNITISNIQLTGEKAGNYKFPSYITLPSSTTGKITPAPLSVTVTGKDKPYDGNTAAQVDVEFTGLQNGETLSAGDYTVTAAFDNPGAGSNKPVTGSVTLNHTAAASNYTLADGSFQTTANISKAILTLTAPTAASIEYGQTLASAELSGGSAESGGQAVAGAWSWAEPQTSPPEDGSYTVKFIPEDAANYAAGETQAAVSVTPAQPKITISAPSRQQAGRPVAVTVHVENPHDPDLAGGLPVPTLSYQIGDGGFSPLEGGALLIPEGTAEGTVVTIKAVTMEVAGKYTAGEKTFAMTVVDKAPVTLSGIVLEDRPYDGQPAAYTGTPAAIDEDGAPVEGLTYTDQWKDAGGNPLTEAPKNAGSYFLTISAESDTHMGEATFPVTILKRRLTWDVSELAASKPQNSEAEATVYGELRLSGVINNEVALNVSGGLTTEGLALITEPGNYQVAVRGTWTFDPASPENYELPDVSDLPTLSARVAPVEELDAPPESTQEKQLKLEMETGISTVPAALLGNSGLNTPAKLETAMRLAITEANSAVTAENIAVYEVSLLVSTNGGATWTPASKDNFPAGGLTVLLPYPEGTSQNTHDFVVTHMFTTNDFGKTPGETEKPAVTKTAGGLRFTVTGLSPISVGWVKKTSQGGGSGGGGGWVSYYTIKVHDSEHGKVTADCTSMYSGGPVTLTVKPDDGYKLGKIIVSDSQGKALELTEKNGKYTFKMPSRDVTVKADFVPAVSPSPEPTGSPSPSPSGSPTPTTPPSPSPKPWKNPFPDVSDTGWYIKAVEYVCTNGLMAGYSNGKFGPNDDLTRAQFAQIIYNKEGRPKADSGRFTDVTTGWYANAVNWAAAEGIVAGVGGGKFAPDRPITRQDLAVMLWRYAGSPEPRKNELDFSDAGKVSEYAWKALCWANENGIVNGKGNRVLDPKGKATRAEAAQMLKNYIED